MMNTIPVVTGFRPRLCNRRAGSITIPLQNNDLQWIAIKSNRVPNVKGS